MKVSVDVDSEEIRDKVAVAIYGAQVAAARKIVDAYDFRIDHIRTVYNSIPFESDRSLAILFFALSEDLMLFAIKYYMKGRPKGGWSDVFSGNGVLSTANDRIAILELLGWIQPKIAQHLRILKNIRNRFAHHANVNTFSEKKIESWISSMDKMEHVTNEVIFDVTNGQKARHTIRDVFVIRVLLLITNLVQDLAVLPAALAHRVNPSDVSGGEFDKTPLHLQELRRLTAEVVIRNCYRGKPVA